MIRRCKNAPRNDDLFLVESGQMRERDTAFFHEMIVKFVGIVEFLEVEFLAFFLKYIIFMIGKTLTYAHVLFFFLGFYNNNIC